MYLYSSIYNNKYSENNYLGTVIKLVKHSNGSKYYFYFNTNILKKENNSKKRLIYTRINIKKETQRVILNTNIISLNKTR